MNKLVVGMSSFVALVASLAAPSVGQAAQLPCVTDLIADIHAGDYNGEPCAGAQMKLVEVSKNGTWVSYTDGYFDLSSSGNPVSGHVPQLFSDREVVSSDPEQPFSIKRGDDHAITINAATGVMTIKNFTWNFTRTVQLSCNGPLLVGSDGYALYVVNHRPGVCVL